MSEALLAGASAGFLVRYGTSKLFYEPVVASKYKN